MESEHCSKFGSNIEEVTSNYHIKTSPRMEWMLVLEREGKSDAEFEAILTAKFPNVGFGKKHHNRRIPDIAQLLLLDSAFQSFAVDHLVKRQRQSRLLSWS